MMMKHYIVYVLRTVPSCTKKHRGAEEMNISEPLTCQWDAWSGQGCFRVWRQWSLEFSLQKDADFCSQKEEFSIRSTLSGDNPNIDHWVNLGNTDHFPHSSAMMLISLNILFQGHQRRKGSNLEARRPMTCYRKYLPGTQYPMMLILNLGCNKEFYKWKK